MKPQFFKARSYELPLGKKTYIMGILNITPDSFSDGGRFNSIEAAIKHAHEMVSNGADILDIGGESTRPGYQEISVEEEISRIVPIVECLTKELKVPVSVDTYKAAVAKKALEAGAHIINDIWGLQRDREMASVVARYGAGIVMMHNQDEKKYHDVMGDIINFLKVSIDIAIKAGISEEYMMTDPGIGFGKTIEQNLEALRRTRELESLGLPILLGTSRKSMIGAILDLPVDERKEGTAATVAYGITQGADVVRVHDVLEMARVARMTDAIVRRG